jgi:hypothetical protein
MNNELSKNNNLNESGKQVYRKLLYFFTNKISVHFTLIKGGWKNGEIIDLSEEKLTLVLKEFVEGSIPFLCEEIELGSIKEYRRKE